MNPKVRVAELISELARLDGTATDRLVLTALAVVVELAIRNSQDPDDVIGALHETFASVDWGVLRGVVTVALMELQASGPGGSP